MAGSARRPDGRGQAAGARTTASTLLTRNIGRPEDIAQAILFLMANRFVSGEVLHVDGGGLGIVETYLFWA
ncbi:SDR family oxidoreductase [Rhizobium viscosum]|uniref:SDR family oxidoreductase n=1 Tax=Rhizobium viscosum TaxID=1673 RepID=UPI0031D0460D